MPSDTQDSTTILV